MKKRNMLAIVAATSLARYLIKKRKEKNKVDVQKTIKKAGLPDYDVEHDSASIENSKMVSEGSQFGVDYYNKWREQKRG